MKTIIQVVAVTIFMYLSAAILRCCANANLVFVV